MAMLMIVAFSVNTFAASVGNGVYREFGFGFFYMLGHAGIVNTVSSGKVTSIIHMTSNGLTQVTLSTFISGASPSGYYGEYGVAGATSAAYGYIKSKANELYNNRSKISYTGWEQLVIDNDTNAKVEVKNIKSIRCDGFVECCYEYYDVKLLGATLWNITTRSFHPNTHNTPSITPTAQRNIMTFVSNSQ